MGSVEARRADLPVFCRECGKSFERAETISEHDAAKVRCPKCNSKKVTQVAGRVHVVTSKKN
jgi:putative FmdB family regulatory protein